MYEQSHPHKEELESYIGGRTNRYAIHIKAGKIDQKIGLQVTPSHSHIEDMQSIKEHAIHNIVVGYVHRLRKIKKYIRKDTCTSLDKMSATLKRLHTRSV